MNSNLIKLQNAKFMKLLFVSFFLFQFSNLNAQETNSIMEFRGNNLFSVEQVSDPKVNSYELLTEIEIVDPNTKEISKISPQQLLELIQSGQINQNNILLKRDRFIETWYKLGNTGYILIGHSETKVSTDYNQNNK
jgi:hypothetical protein